MLMDTLKSDKVFYDKKAPWSDIIMSPERTVQEYEKILQFKSRTEAEPALRVLNIFMYGNTSIGEEHHLEVFAGYANLGKTLRGWFWALKIHTDLNSILSMSFEKADLLYKRQRAEYDTLVDKQETGLLATPVQYMKSKQLARLKELRILIDDYLSAKEGEK